MNKDYSDFLNILKLHIFNKAIDNSISCNWENMFKLGNIHNVMGMMYVSLKENKTISQNLKSAMQKKFLVTSAYGFMQERVIASITKELNKNNIPHILIKGGVIRNYYPYPELRTMGDIDILVRDFSGIDDIMSCLGYKSQEIIEGEHIFENGKSTVEIHTKLGSMNFKENVDFDRYFENIFQKAVSPNNNCSYELTPENHIIFMLVHMAKHFHNEGCGIRMVMDLALTIDKFNSKLNWDYILNEISKLHLSRFSKNILKITCKLFDIKLDFLKDYKLNNELFESIVSYILEGGVFGFENNSHLDTTLLRIEEEKGIINKLLAIKKWLFPSSKEMRNLCSWFNKAPVILLPLAWLDRDIKLIFNKEKISKLFLGGENRKKISKTVNSLGLYDK